MEQEFYIDQKDWNKIINYAQVAYDTHQAEIGGMLVAIQDKDDDWELKDPVILKQQISGSNCVLDKDDLALYYTRVGTKLKNKNFRFVWWHSHHKMKAFWSGTDIDAIKEYNDGDFSFALVVNLKEEYKFRVSVWKPFEVHSDIELSILNHSRKLPKRILDEVEEKCQTMSYYNHIGYRSLGKSNQMTLINAQQNGGNHTSRFNFTPSELSGDTDDYIYVYKQLDEMNKQYCDGILTYENWIKKAKQVNKVLKDIHNSPYSIELITQPVLDNNSMFATPHEYISIDYTDIYEESEDEDMWNKSFGVN